MPRTVRPNWQKLTYHKARRQWKKFRNGRVYYLGRGGVNKTDREAHDEALAEWQRIEAELEQRQEREAEVLSTIGDFAAELPREVRVAEARRLQDLNVVFAEAHGKRSKSETIDHHIRRFLASFRTAVTLKKKSVTRHESLRVHLNRFANWRSTRRKARCSRT